MTTLRKFIYYFTGFITFIVLLQLPFGFAVSNVFSNPSNIDQVLEDGGVYKNFVNLALENAQEQGDENTKKLLADQKLKDAISSSIQPSDIQSSSKSVIDGVYAWLEGKTSRPEFTIDLSQPAQKAVSEISTYAQQRSSSLPPCTIEQLQTVNLQSDLLSIPCLPPGVSSAQIGQQFAQQAKDHVELLKKPVISSADVLKEADLTQSEYTDAPKAYQNLHQSKWYNLIFVLILMALLIFARKDRIAGLRFTGKLVLAAGLVLALVLLLLMSGNASTDTDNKIGDVLISTMISLLGQLAMTIKWFTVGYLILGVGGIFLAKRLTPTAIDTPQETQPPITTK